jgi:hypothetical protein
MIASDIMTRNVHTIHAVAQGHLVIRDEAYHELLEKGLKPVSEPRNRTGGIREFMLRDPDGSLLVFFRKK